MGKENYEWLPLDLASSHFGYSSSRSFSRRLRQLREQGHVVDIGRPPEGYKIGKAKAVNKVIIMWPNPKIALLRSDAPEKLLNPKRGKRKKN